MKVDHIALVVDSPTDAAHWYAKNFGCTIKYADPTWAIVEFENTKIAFVTKGQHPPHFAFEVKNLPKNFKKHRDGSESVYQSDPWGNIFELVRYRNE